MNRGGAPAQLESRASIEARVGQGHRLWHAGDLPGARSAWHAATMQRWAHCRHTGADRLGLRILSGRWVANLGHFFYLDAYLKLVRLGLVDARQVALLLTPGDRIANPALLSTFQEHLLMRVVERGPVPADLDEAAFWLGEDLDYLRLDGDRGIGLPEATVLAQSRWAEAGLPPLVRTTPEIDEAGEAFLRSQGIGPRDWFVTLHARTSGYNGNPPSRRDCRIEDYEPAIRRLAARGARVIRLGDRTMPPAPPVPGLVDHARTSRPDPRVDVYLVARCKLLVGCASGPSYLAPLFGVPSLLVNWAPMNCRPLGAGSYYLPRLYREHGSGRVLSMGEVMARRLGSIEFDAPVREHGLAIADNTPGEIEEAVDWILDRLLERSAPTPEERRLEEGFAAAADAAGIVGVGRVVPAFARDYPEAWQAAPAAARPVREATA